MKRMFDIPVTWMMSGTEHIEAETLPEAVAIARQQGRSLPQDQQYVDDSYRIEEELVNMRNMPEGNSLCLHSIEALLIELKVRAGWLAGSPSEALANYGTAEIQQHLWVYHGVKFDRKEDAK